MDRSIKFIKMDILIETNHLAPCALNLKLLPKSSRTEKCMLTFSSTIAVANFHAYIKFPKSHYNSISSRLSLGIDCA